MTTRAATLRNGSTIPRRRSGPARARTAPPRRKQSTDSFAALGRMALRVPDARLLDRLIRGRLWIGLIGGALVMLVFMQVSLLKLNTGISADIATSQSLERSNSELRASVSSLDSGQRIQDIAASRGMVMPDDGQLRFLEAGPAGDGAQAADDITAPDSAGAQQRAQAMAAQVDQQQADAAASQQAAMTQQAAAATTGTSATASTTTTNAATTSAATTTAATATTAPPPSTTTAQTAPTGPTQ
jgi:hypothetical protein